MTQGIKRTPFSLINDTTCSRIGVQLAILYCPGQGELFFTLKNSFIDRTYDDERTLTVVILDAFSRVSAVSVVSCLTLLTFMCIYKTIKQEFNVLDMQSWLHGLF